MECSIADKHAFYSIMQLGKQHGMQISVHFIMQLGKQHGMQIGVLFIMQLGKQLDTKQGMTH